MAGRVRSSAGFKVFVDAIKYSQILFSEAKLRWLRLQSPSTLSVHFAARRRGASSFATEQVVPLTSKAFETLLALVENARSILAKDELLRRVWPDTVVEESNLTQTVFMLRKALGEKVAEHRYIVTVPKRGYCFVADVREVPRRAGPALRSPGDPRGGASRRAPRRTSCASRGVTSGRSAPRGGGKGDPLLRAGDRAGARVRQSLRGTGGLLRDPQPLQPAPAPHDHAEGEGRGAARAADRRTLVEAHTSLAVVRMLYDWDWPPPKPSSRGAAARARATPRRTIGTACTWWRAATSTKALPRSSAPSSSIRSRSPSTPTWGLSCTSPAGTTRRSAVPGDHGAGAALLRRPDGPLMATTRSGLFHQPISEFLRPRRH